MHAINHGGISTFMGLNCWIIIVSQFKTLCLWQKMLNIMFMANKSDQNFPNHTELMKYNGEKIGTW